MSCHLGLLRAVAVLSFAVLFLSSTVSAQPRPGKPEEGPVYIDPAHTDDDFPLQGEYVGWRQFSRWQRDSRRAGLQVIALGNGQFAATGYIGGLPGDGWPGGERQLFAGQRQGDVVVLTAAESSGVGASGQGRQLVVDGRAARLLSDDGRLMGEFHKVCRVSPTLGARPPRGATVLFDGSDTSRLVDAAVTADGLLQAGTVTADAYGDFRMHAEFRLPYKPLGRGQNRGNSGFYLQSRYEVQVLDTFGLEGVENECGALYKTRRPDVNMCYPPLAWQTYDIDFAAARFDEQGNKVRDMRISVWHNGVPIHADVAISHKTGAGQPEGPDPLPTKIQDHRNPVMFRNIWLIERSLSLGTQGDAVASTAGRN